MALMDLVKNPKTYFFTYAKDVSGETNAVGNYLNNPTEFKISPPIGKTWYLDTFTIHLKSAHTEQMIRMTGYGGSDLLENGCRFYIKDKITGDIILDLFAGRTVKRIVHWLHLGSSLTRDDHLGSEDFINIKWSIYKTTGFYLTLTDKEELVILLQDNFNDLLSRQRFIAQGLQK